MRSAISRLRKFLNCAEHIIYYSIRGVCRWGMDNISKTNDIHVLLYIILPGGTILLAHYSPTNVWGILGQL